MADALDTTTTTTTTATAETTPEPKWFDSFTDDLKTHADITAFKGPDELAKAYLDTKGKLPVVPETYEFQFPKELDAEWQKSFITAAKKIGLTQEQFAALAQDQVAEFKAAAEAVSAAKKEAVDALRKEWGANTEARITDAEKVAKALFGEDYLQHFDIKNAPVVLKGLYHLSTKLGEDTLKLGGGPVNARPEGPDGRPRIRYPSMEK